MGWSEGFFVIFQQEPSLEMGFLPAFNYSKVQNIVICVTNVWVKGNNSGRGYGLESLIRFRCVTENVVFLGFFIFLEENEIFRRRRFADAFLGGGSPTNTNYVYRHECRFRFYSTENFFFVKNYFLSANKSRITVRLRFWKEFSGI